MPITLNPYLSFRDNACQAMEFYNSVFGGELHLSTFGESQMQDPSEANKVMHSQITTPNGITLMASDTPNDMEYREGGNGSISLSGEEEAELRGDWDRLSKGATIIEPLKQAPWGDTFGMLKDQFGVTWLVNIAGKRG